LNTRESIRRLAADDCEPRLFMARFSRRPIIVAEDLEAGRLEVFLKRFHFKESSVAFSRPALLRPARVGSEENASRLECGSQLAEHAGQLLRRDVE
jgi:hypothetical protein